MRCYVLCAAGEVANLASEGVCVSPVNEVIPMGYIYMIKNTINGKCYIGQTTRSMAETCLYLLTADSR